MSLIKQLWLGIIMILLLALGGSFAISVYSAKQYLHEQLQLKNIDNATSLALSMSQMEKDPVTLELLVAAQFDAGHYQLIRLTDPNNQIIVERIADTDTVNATPAWFARMADLQVRPGVAQVQDGWQQYGTLTVESHAGFAHASLWNSALNLLQWFLMAAFISGFVGTWILKYISRPLDMVVQQAEAIGERRFTISEEPKTREFQRLVRAMNALSDSVKAMLEKETQQLEILRQESQHDSLTTLFNRAHFLNLLDAQLTKEDSASNGTLLIARILNLAELNHQLGHAETDKVLCGISAGLQKFCRNYANCYAGRLNGSDFAVVMPGYGDADSLSNELSLLLMQQPGIQELPAIALPLAACRYQTGEKRNELMHKLDGALAQAELKGDHAVITLSSDAAVGAHRNLNEWRDAISAALRTQKLELAGFPVKTSDENILHLEAPVRLRLDEKLQSAGYFVPWASRLGMMPQIDFEVIETALAQVSAHALPLAVNVSADALCDAGFRDRVIKLLGFNSDKIPNIWLEFSESCAVRHAAEFRSFSHSLRELGCRVGLEHVGPEFTRITELQDMGLHFLKIDSAIIRDIHSNNGNQSFVQGLCKIGHSLGITMIAEGVNTAEEKHALFKLGMDAVTGPAA